MWTDDERKDMYREIFRRKSLRKYQGDELALGIRERLLAAANEKAFRLNDSPCVFKILSASEVEKPFCGAPHYLAAYASGEGDKGGRAAVLNASFILQQLSLSLSANDIGSCWLGMAKPRPGFMETEAEGVRLPFFKMMAFGKGLESIYRSDLTEFKRKSLGEISDIPGMNDLLEAVRLAPSAVNQQAWFFSGDTSTTAPTKIRVFEGGGPFLMKKMLAPLRLVDAGIALCHLWLTLAEAGRFKAYTMEDNIALPRKGLSYVQTAELAS